MKCPNCGKHDGSRPYTQWIYAGYEVSRHVCENCSERYNVYEADGKVKFTVPKQRAWGININVQKNNFRFFIKSNPIGELSDRSVIWPWLYN